MRISRPDGQTITIARDIAGRAASCPLSTCGVTNERLTGARAAWNSITGQGFTLISCSTEEILPMPDRRADQWARVQAKITARSDLLLPPAELCH